MYCNPSAGYSRFICKYCNSPEVFHIIKQRNSLQSFTKTHLISQDTIDTILIQPQSVKISAPNLFYKSNLVISHLSTLNVCRTFIKTDHILLDSIQVRQKLLILLLGHPVPVVAILALHHLPLARLLLEGRVALEVPIKWENNSVCFNKK